MRNGGPLNVTMCHPCFACTRGRASQTLVQPKCCIKSASRIDFADPTHRHPKAPEVQNIPKLPEIPPSNTETLYPNTSNSSDFPASLLLGPLCPRQAETQTCTVPRIEAVSPSGRKNPHPPKEDVHIVARASICMCVCIYIYTYIHIHTNTHRHTHTHTSIQPSMHPSSHPSIHPSIHPSMSIHPSIPTHYLNYCTVW